MMIVYLNLTCHWQCSLGCRCLLGCWCLKFWCLWSHCFLGSPKTPLAMPTRPKTPSNAPTRPKTPLATPIKSSPTHQQSRRIHRGMTKLHPTTQVLQKGHCFVGMASGGVFGLVGVSDGVFGFVVVANGVFGLGVSDCVSALLVCCARNL